LKDNKGHTWNQQIWLVKSSKPWLKLITNFPILLQKNATIEPIKKPSKGKHLMIIIFSWRP